MVLAYTKKYRFLAKKSDSNLILGCSLRQKKENEKGKNKQRYLGYIIFYVLNLHGQYVRITLIRAIPHNSKCRYGERGAAAAKPKTQIILDAAKVSAAGGGNSEPKQGQRSQSARGFCPRSTMRVPQPDIIEHFGNADAVPQPPKRCLSR